MGALTGSQGMEWNGKNGNGIENDMNGNGMESDMEWKENFDMEHGRCSEWNGEEDLKNGMEDRLPYFHTNCIHIQYISKLTTNCEVLPN